MLEPEMKMKYAMIALCLAAVDHVANGQVLNEDFKLKGSDGAVGASFGISIAIDNGIVAVGADFDDNNGSFTGSAHLFNASTGAKLDRLTAIDARSG